MEEEKNEFSFWSTLGNIVSFGIGLFIIYSIISSQSKEGKKSVKNERERKPIKQKKEIRQKVKDVLPINERQNSILAAIRRKGEMTPSVLYAIAPNVSTRTLRRDMDVLVKLGLVRQDGNTKSTKYTYIG